VWESCEAYEYDVRATFNQVVPIITNVLLKKNYRWRTNGLNPAPMPTTWCNWPPDIETKTLALQLQWIKSVTVHQKVERDMNYLHPHNTVRLAGVTLMTKIVRPKYLFCYWITNKANVVFFVSRLKKERWIYIAICCEALLWHCCTCTPTSLVCQWNTHTHTHTHTPFVVLPPPLIFPFQFLTRPVLGYIFILVTPHKKCNIHI
jgi:hypothetical protein